MASFERSSLPEPWNEPSRSYAPGTVERGLLREALKKMKNECPEIPCIVGGKEVRTGEIQKQVMPSNHKHVVCTFHQATPALLQEAVSAALQAKVSWEAMPTPQRLAVFSKAAELLSTKYRYEMLAATMLGQGKTVWQGEIDAISETVDFWRFNPWFAQQIYAQQPPKNSHGVWNRLQYRPLEGFVVAISPFNFTAIGANLSTSPALMGNVVLWKPASTAVLSNYLCFNILKEAGLPDGVINFLPGSGRVIGEALLNHPEFSGLHFTGSTGVFNSLLQKTSENLTKGLYRCYPRMVGETGGKDFHFIHESADFENALANTIRGAFEYQGQKCSACSRLYVPSTMWPAFKAGLIEATKEIKTGHPEDFETFMSAVIDASAFKSISGYIKEAKGDPNTYEIVCGGDYDDSEGYFITPTVVLSKDPKSKLMREEIFGPVLTVYVYSPDKLDETLHLCDTASPYGLTGAIFARDPAAITKMSHALRNAAGNFYINDKCTGAVVGQQPFGGGRASGTNDKAGSLLNLYRWVSAMAIKENFHVQSGWRYPYMDKD